jgi:16S rRNA (cytosine967-C5)-methyltransferase
MRRRVDARWRLKPDDFARMKRRQLAIVNAVIDLLKPGGVLVYSTCSLEPEENEGVADGIRGAKEFETRQQILPFRDHFDGAFVARFLKDR